MAGLVVSQMRLPVIAVGVGIVALGAGWYVVYARDRAVEEGLLDDALNRLREDLPAGVPGSIPTASIEDRYTAVVPVANPRHSIASSSLQLPVHRHTETSDIPNWS